MLHAAFASWLLAAAWGVAALDANTASPDQLETIRGIGPALSSRIIEARTRKPFSDLEDLKARVRGVGASNLRKMRAAGLDVGPSGQVTTLVGQRGAAQADFAAQADSEGARNVQTFVGRPAERAAAVVRTSPGERASEKRASEKRVSEKRAPETRAPGAPAR